MKQYILYLAAATMLASGCSRISAGKETTAKRDPVTVRVQTISKSTTSETAAYIGTVRPDKSALITAKYSGTVTALNVKKGDKVGAGQVLAVIESQNVRSSREMAHASLEQAEDAYRRAAQVHESGSMADVKMVEATTRLNQAVAAAASADKALEDCTMKAPFDGYVDDVFTDEGVNLDTFGPVARIVDISSVEIHFSVPENEIGVLHVGQGIRLDVGATGISGAEGKIRSKGVSASPLSHCYDCIATLDSPYPGLMPGMVCRLNLSRQGAEEITVPASVLLTGTDGRYLWLVRDGAAYKRKVKVGGFSGRNVIITDGLSEGDKVIVSGYQKVSTGMKVRTEEIR